MQRGGIAAAMSVLLVYGLSSVRIVALSLPCASGSAAVFLIHGAVGYEETTLTADDAPPWSVGWLPYDDPPPHWVFALWPHITHYPPGMTVKLTVTVPLWPLFVLAMFVTALS
jgi:hypothetical protein